MPYLYILQSLKNSRYYIGSTTNLKRRIEEHNRGKTPYTKLTKPFKLVYKEFYDNITEARKREIYIKKMKSSKYINWLIKQRLERSGLTGQVLGSAKPKL